MVPSFVERAARKLGVAKRKLTSLPVSVVLACEGVPGVGQAYIHGVMSGHAALPSSLGVHE
jgi:hypothetical protein